MKITIKDRYFVYFVLDMSRHIQLYPITKASFKLKTCERARMSLKREKADLLKYQFSHFFVFRLNSH